jgi:hypothetical protein
MSVRTVTEEVQLPAAVALPIVVDEQKESFESKQNEHRVVVIASQLKEKKRREISFLDRTLDWLHENPRTTAAVLTVSLVGLSFFLRGNLKYESTTTTKKTKPGGESTHRTTHQVFNLRIGGYLRA